MIANLLRVLCRWETRHSHELRDNPTTIKSRTKVLEEGILAPGDTLADVGLGVAIALRLTGMTTEHAYRTRSPT